MIAEALPVLHGSPTPRIAPPRPLKTDLKTFKKVAAEVGIKLMPWQETAARYLEALTPAGHHLYRECAIVVARQNGKTTELVPLIVKRLRARRRIMHTAQNRDLPREVFAQVAEIFGAENGLLMRGGRPVMPRFANGQEEIKLANGGRYKIVAPTRAGPRGPANDDVLVDEVRELHDFEFIAAAKPTLTASPDPQIVYLSNEGDEESVVLISIRERASQDPRLAYLEWSAAPHRAADDIEGWLEANPAIGHKPGMLEYLTDEYRSSRLDGTLAIFETEHLCRSVVSLRPSLVSVAAWNDCETAELSTPIRPALGVAVDAESRRAAAVMAWLAPDGVVELQQLYDVPVSVEGVDKLGRDLRAEARTRGIAAVGFGPATDAQLARHLVRAEGFSARVMANATARFVELVEARRLRWHDAAPVGADISWTTRKTHEDGFIAVPAADDRPVSAILAAIRAVWLASLPSRAAMTGRQPVAVAGF